MATTRRPQINHRNCGHAATPAERKACRKAFWAANPQATEAQIKDLPEHNMFRSAASGLSHGLAHLADGTPVPACSRKATKGQAEYLDRWTGPTCNRCSSAHRTTLG